MRTLRHERGFTLIELLVVVAVIAVLIAIMVPSLSKARDRAKLVVCQTHMRAWGQGFLMYANDFNGRLPLDGGDGTAQVPIGKWSDPYLWFNGVVAYTVGANKTYDQIQEDAILGQGGGNTIPKGGQNSLFVCPSAGDPGAGSGDILTNNNGNPSFPQGYFLTTGWYTTSPVFSEQRPMLLCYGMNSQLRSYDFSTPDYASNSPGDGDVGSLTQLKPAAMIPLLAEKRINPNELPKNHPSYSKALTQSKVTANRFAARHSKGGNIVFADGHVEWMLNSSLDNPNALKANYYNIHGVIIWNPNGT
jgi:prepilin-type N-terminal cleavage/methylation domain-containing protein/prepilin-type processing-associated H-X9-DG protein